jgi:hypothetical protein
MRFRSESSQLYINRVSDSRDWYAWFPVRIDGETIAWLEVVQARRSKLYGNDFGQWYYCAKEKPTENNNTHRKLEDYFPW